MFAIQEGHKFAPRKPENELQEDPTILTSQDDIC